MAKSRTTVHPYRIQAPAEKYQGTDYLSPERLSSVGYQFQLAVQTKGQSFLNIGSAHGLLEILLDRAGLHVIALDLDYAVSPNLVGVLPRLPVKDACTDVVMAFQVLEHMPIEMLQDCLMELRRVARMAILISLPDQTPFWQSYPTSSRMESLAIRFHHWSWARQTWRFEKSVPLDPEHFWEIGHENISSETIVEIAERSGLRLARMFRNPCFTYHTFFVFERVTIHR